MAGPGHVTELGGLAVATGSATAVVATDLTSAVGNAGRSLRMAGANAVAEFGSFAVATASAATIVTTDLAGAVGGAWRLFGVDRLTLPVGVTSLAVATLSAGTAALVAATVLVRAGGLAGGVGRNGDALPRSIVASLSIEAETTGSATAVVAALLVVAVGGAGCVDGLELALPVGVTSLAITALAATSAAVILTTHFVGAVRHAGPRTVVLSHAAVEGPEVLHGQRVLGLVHAAVLAAGSEKHKGREEAQTQNQPKKFLCHVNLLKVYGVFLSPNDTQCAAEGLFKTI